MKTKKILAMSNFIEAYRDLVREAFRYYVAYIEYDLSLNGTTKMEKNRFALNAFHFATRANAVYDSAFYAGLKGLPEVLLDIQKRECGCYGCLDGETTIDNIQDWVWDYIEDQMLVDIDEYNNLKGGE